jgi:hypothetical protein
VKKLSRPDLYIRESTALNPNKPLAELDASKGKVLPKGITEDSSKMILGVPRHSLQPHMDWVFNMDLFSARATDSAVIMVVKGVTILLTPASAQPSSLLWTEPISTIPRLPPRTKEERLSMWGDEAGETIVSLNAEKYKDALRRLDSLNDSVRNVILSGELPSEISENLDNALESLESCKQVIYDGIKEGKAAETIQRHGLVPILEGFGKLFKAYANLDEWKDRMVAEWGGNRG